MHTAKSAKAKNHMVFSYNKENFKKYVLACILALITSLLKSREFGQYFKNSKNIYFVLFCFSIKDYEFIHKTYSRY
jgi:hemolysin-activating ACP:hemolysin acyltransferase